MGWIGTIFAALIVAGLGALASFMMALGAVEWLRIPAREGESGYFVVLMGLIGLIGGIVIALVASRFSGAGFDGFFKTIGISTLALIVIIGSLGGIAWLQDDPVPQVIGHDVRIEYELRSYDGFMFDPAAPRDDRDGESPIAVSLYAPTSGGRNGTMRLAKARQESARWIFPGSILLSSSRRSLDFGLRVEEGKTVFIPFQAPRPSAATDAPEWSEWLTARPDSEKPKETGPDGLAIRYHFTVDGFEPEP